MFGKNDVMHCIRICFCILCLPVFSAQATGEIKWNIFLGGERISSPAVGDDGTVYVSSDDGWLYAVSDDGDSARLLWKFQTGGLNLSYPVVALSEDAAPHVRIYVTASDGILYAVRDDGNKGTQIQWAAKSIGNFCTSPAIGDDGRLYAGTSDGKIYALNSGDGTLEWSSPFQSGKAIPAPPVIGPDGTVYAITAEGSLYAMQAENGIAVWEKPFPAGEGIVSSPVIHTDKTVYTGISQGRFYALEFSDAGIAWEVSYDTDDSLIVPPAISSDGYIYAGTEKGTVNGISNTAESSSSGEDTDTAESQPKKWAEDFQADGAVSGAPFIASDGKIYFSTDAGKIYALYSDKKEVSGWPVSIGGGSLSSPVIVNGSTMYIGSGDGKLYAVETDSSGMNRNSSWAMFAHDVRNTGRNTANQAPTAYAGEDQTVSESESVSLDASASYDPDYGIASYSWTQTGGSSVTLSDKNAIRPVFTAPGTESTEESLTFQVQVTDYSGATSADTVEIKVEEDDSFCFIRSCASEIFSAYIH